MLQSHPQCILCRIVSVTAVVVGSGVQLVFIRHSMRIRVYSMCWCMCPLRILLIGVMSSIIYSICYYFLFFVWYIFSLALSIVPMFLIQDISGLLCMFVGWVTIRLFFWDRWVNLYWIELNWIILPLRLPSYYWLGVNRLSTITNDQTPNIENPHG